MTTYGPFFNPIMLVIGTLGLIILVVIAGLWKGERPAGYWMISALEAGGCLVLWGTLALLMRFLFYRGGTIEFIVFMDTLADLGSYMAAVGTLIITEMYRDRERRFENFRRRLIQETSSNESDY